MTRCILFVCDRVCVCVTEIYSVRGRYNGIYIHEIQLLTAVSLYNNLVQGRGTPCTPHILRTQLLYAIFEEK